MRPAGGVAERHHGIADQIDDRVTSRSKSIAKSGKQRRIPHARIVASRSFIPCLQFANWLTMPRNVDPWLPLLTALKSYALQIRSDNGLHLIPYN